MDSRFNPADESQQLVNIYREIAKADRLNFSQWLILEGDNQADPSYEGAKERYEIYCRRFGDQAALTLQ